MRYAQIGDLVGKTIKEIDSNPDEIVFHAVSGERWRMFHAQDCCESVTVEDIVGDLGDLIGTPIVMAEDASSEAPQNDDPARDIQWTFYKLATAKGYVTIRWYGESNGYYGTGVDFVLLDTEGR